MFTYPGHLMSLLLKCWRRLLGRGSHGLPDHDVLHQCRHHRANVLQSAISGLAKGHLAREIDAMGER